MAFGHIASLKQTDLTIRTHVWHLYLLTVHNWKLHVNGEVVSTVPNDVFAGDPTLLVHCANPEVVSNGRQTGIPLTGRICALGVGGGVHLIGGIAI